MRRSMAAPDAYPAACPEVRHDAGVARGWVAADVELLVAVQHGFARPVTINVARALSRFGEHSVGWFVAGLAGAVADRQRRSVWLAAAVGAVGAHAAAIAVKRVVRRPRPMDERVTVHLDTPGRLGFPSSHASSTTAAAVLFAAASGLGRPLVPALVAPMLVSRVVLGVHYPTDVVAGAALGAAVASGVRGVSERGGAQHSTASRAACGEAG